jgi:hypothetical protein
VPASVDLINAEGRLMLSSEDFGAGEGSYRIQADKLPSGIYILSVSGSMNGTETRNNFRIIKTDY